VRFATIRSIRDLRNQTLKNAAAILDALGSERLTREEIEARLKERGIKLKPYPLVNLLLDLRELGWIEQQDGKHRIGLGLALVYRSALDAEKREARKIMGRLESLTMENTEK